MTELMRLATAVIAAHRRGTRAEFYHAVAALDDWLARHATMAGEARNDADAG